MSPPKRIAPGGNIVLIGFMGSGKTEVGRQIARRTQRAFIDTDALVEADGVSTADIFAAEGEVGFRRREREAVAKASRAKGAVVSTGGGAVLFDENIAALKRTGVLVYLRARSDELTRRLEASRDRPLIDTSAEGRPDAARRRRRIRDLLSSRLPAYEKAADVVVDTDGRSVTTVAAEVLRRLEVGRTAKKRVQVVEVAVPTPYRVHVGRGLLRRAGTMLTLPPGAEKACVISHQRIARLWGGALEEGLGSLGVKVIRVNFPEGEGRKTLETAGRLLRRLASAQFHRSDVVIALGGGVVGDVAGFVASTYARGIPLVHVPTTMLAMVDSSIGGKAGVNLPEGKNLVGSFYHPIAVLADPDTLGTLSNREFCGGMAEVAKYALIADPSLGDLLTTRRQQILAREEAVAEVVRRSAEIKAHVVSTDEREAGQRMILNYGHTLGHALEGIGISAKGRGGMHHGEAIAVGMMFAAWLSVILELAPAELVATHERLLQAYDLPTSAGKAGWEEVRRYMQVDKKYDKGLRFVLLEEPGRPVIRSDIPDEALRAAFDRVTEGS